MLKPLREVREKRNAWHVPRSNWRWPWCFYSCSASEREFLEGFLPRQLGLTQAPGLCHCSDCAVALILKEMFWLHRVAMREAWWGWKALNTLLRPSNPFSGWKWDQTKVALFAWVTANPDYSGLRDEDPTAKRTRVVFFQTWVKTVDSTCRAIKFLQ